MKKVSIQPLLGLPKCGPSLSLLDTPVGTCTHTHPASRHSAPSSHTGLRGSCRGRAPCLTRHPHSLCRHICLPGSSSGIHHPHLDCHDPQQAELPPPHTHTHCDLRQSTKPWLVLSMRTQHAYADFIRPGDLARVCASLHLGEDSGVRTFLPGFHLVLNVSCAGGWWDLHGLSTGTFLPRLLARAPSTEAQPLPTAVRKDPCILGPCPMKTCVPGVLAVTRASYSAR